MTDWETLRSPQLSILNIVNLNDVTENDEGDVIDLQLGNKSTVFFQATGGSVSFTVNVEASPSGDFNGEEDVLGTFNFISAGKKTFQFEKTYIPHMRTTITNYVSGIGKSTICART